MSLHTLFWGMLIKCKITAFKPSSNTQLVLTMLNWDHQQELEADLQAVRWLLALTPNSDNLWIKAVSKLRIMSFEILMLIHFVEAALRLPPTTSHPPAIFRLAYIAGQDADLMSDAERAEVKEWLRIAAQVAKAET